MNRRSVQQRSTATTALFNAFGFIQMRPGQRKQGNKRLLRGVRDEEVAGSNPVTPTVERLVRCLFRIWMKLASETPARTKYASHANTAAELPGSLAAASEVTSSFADTRGRTTKPAGGQGARVLGLSVDQTLIGKVARITVAVMKSVIATPAKIH